MEVKLYINTEDSRRIKKSPSFIETVSCSVTGAISITSPSLILDTSRTDFNYIRIESLGRYYYVNDIQILTGNRVLVSCAVDVLMSAQSVILSSPCMVIRSGKGMTDITDTKLPIPKTNFIESHFLTDTDFPENNYMYAVTVFGGE